LAKGKPYFVLALLVILAAALVGCDGELGVYTVSGTVWEEDSGNPLAGAAVTLGEQRTVTNARGQYAFAEVPGGEQLLQVELAGYEPASVQLNLRKDSTVDVGLVSPLPVLRDSGFHFVDGEGAVLKAGEGTTAPRAEILYYLRFLFADPDAVEIDSVEAVLNGVVIGSALYREMWMGAAGLPLEPGTNTVQLRVWDSAGWARTSKLYTIDFDVERLDLRVLLSWDKDADLDLHLFKRESDEGNVFDWYTEDRHLSYWSQPEDFGEGPAQNPVLDWDGYGPRGWDGLYLEEMTPGDYHIWISAWHIAEPTQAQVKVIVDATADTRSESITAVELTEDDQDLPVYITTVRVHEDGTKELIHVEPEVASIAEG
jgi:hypothetical protein